MTKGNISERDFDILIKLSGIHSEKAILALKKYYVDGVIRKIDPTHVMWTRPKARLCFQIVPGGDRHRHCDDASDCNHTRYN